MIVGYDSSSYRLFRFAPKRWSWLLLVIVISRFLQERAKYTPTRLERHEGNEYFVSLKTSVV